MASLIDFSQPSLYVACASIVFNPLFWNIAARQEYHHKTITKLFGGNSLYGCYGLGATIFLLGILRDYIYHNALLSQPAHPLLTTSPITTTLLSFLLLTTGNTLVLTSMYALGVTGTYLGDYFGILMDDMVTGFPFSVTSAPMYWGSTCSFAGTALWYGRPAGLVLSALVAACYWVALGFEDPFTAGIYERREKKRGKVGNGVVGKKEL